MPVYLSPAKSALVLWQLYDWDSLLPPSQTPVSFKRNLSAEGIRPMCIFVLIECLDFFAERDLLTLIFVVNGAKKNLSTSAMNRVFSVSGEWGRIHSSQLQPHETVLSWISSVRQQRDGLLQ